MSELKPYIGPHPTDRTLAEFYLKSEADKVIAELKADYKEACDRLQTANLIKDEQLAETRHQKYKRCLTMAYVEWLKQMSLWNYPESILYRRAARRERKWKELAEKFKQGLVIGVDKATGTDKTVVITYKEAK